MNPEGVDLLSQLRDIHAAPTAPWWPPAPGWWVLAAIALLSLAYLAHRGLKAWRVHQRKGRMIEFIESIENTLDPRDQPQAYLAEINKVLKIVAMRAFPNVHCASLQGAEWTGFLREKIGDESPGLDALAAGPYQVAPEFDPAVLGNLTRRWIRNHG